MKMCIMESKTIGEMLSAVTWKIKNTYISIEFRDLAR